MPSTSRRAVVASLAALPTIPTTAAAMSVTVADDPIFAAIERYRHACAALDSADQRNEPAQYDAAEHDIINSSEALWVTPPQTIEGGDGVGGFCPRRRSPRERRRLGLPRSCVVERGAATDGRSLTAPGTPRPQGCGLIHGDRLRNRPGNVIPFASYALIPAAPVAFNLCHQSFASFFRRPHANDALTVYKAVICHDLSDGEAVTAPFAAPLTVGFGHFPFRCVHP